MSAAALLLILAALVLAFYGLRRLVRRFHAENRRINWLLADFDRRHPRHEDGPL